MNQALQFPDREEWNAERQVVCFPALHHGMQLWCAITATELFQRYGEGQALEIFRQYRWDLEEEAEALIATGQDDADGWFWLCSDKQTSFHLT